MSTTQPCSFESVTYQLLFFRSEIEGFLDDYSFLIKGLLDYYKASLDLSALNWAKELQETQDKLFWDERNGAYFFSQRDSPNVIVRLKDGMYMNIGILRCNLTVSSFNRS